jgi:hypothetical protein
MTIKVVDAVQEDLMEEVWDLYFNAFEELNAFAVQRHLMFRTEFDEVMLDSRVQKYLYLADDGSVCGLSTYTNVLEAMPLISPAYFARRWPQHYAEHRVWYCGFVAVQKSRQAVHAFAELVEAMYLEAARHNGLIALDFCRFNDEARHMSRAVELRLGRINGGVRAECMDEQQFWLYEPLAAA